MFSSVAHFSQRYRRWRHSSSSTAETLLWMMHKQFEVGGGGEAGIRPLLLFVLYYIGVCSLAGRPCAASRNSRVLPDPRQM
jgi:hypothetical protein